MAQEFSAYESSVALHRITVEITKPTGAYGKKITNIYNVPMRLFVADNETVDVAYIRKSREITQELWGMTLDDTRRDLIHKLSSVSSEKNWDIGTFEDWLDDAGAWLRDAIKNFQDFTEIFSWYRLFRPDDNILFACYNIMNGTDVVTQTALAIKE